MREERLGATPLLGALGKDQCAISDHAVDRLDDCFGWQFKLLNANATPR